MADFFSIVAFVMMVLSPCLVAMNTGVHRLAEGPPDDEPEIPEKRRRA
jgi:hypothetical protein